VARFSASDIRRLLRNDGIVRHRAKIEAAIDNARAIRAIQREYGTFATYSWRFVGGTPIQNAWTSLSEVPSATDISRALSRDLSARGCRFVGPIICYAFMQSVGMVNDHVVSCFRWAVVRRLARQRAQEPHTRRAALTRRGPVREAR
jgi:DNA-3-methyladenine glycosylase I